MILYTYDEKKNKMVKAGNLKNGVFTKRVNTKKHFMNLTQGYAIQEDVIVKLKDYGCLKIVIIDEDKTKLESYLSDWLESDIKVLDFNHGRQRHMPCSRMEII